jgi:hypothetical protein
VCDSLNKKPAFQHKRLLVSEAEIVDRKSHIAIDAKPTQPTLLRYTKSNKRTTNLGRRRRAFQLSKMTTIVRGGVGVLLRHGRREQRQRRQLRGTGGWQRGAEQRIDEPLVDVDRRALLDAQLALAADERRVVVVAAATRIARHVAVVVAHVAHQPSNLVIAAITRIWLKLHNRCQVVQK